MTGLADVAKGRESPGRAEDRRHMWREVAWDSSFGHFFAAFSFARLQEST